MAPVQSRQLLMWSFPTAVVLFSYLYYKRKKAFLNSDTGGKSIASSQVNADAELILDSSSIHETLESSIQNSCKESYDSCVVSSAKEAEDVKAVIQKVIRDLETIAPIPENSPIEEIVEDVLQITDTSNIDIDIEDETLCEVSSSANSTKVNSCKKISPQLQLKKTGESNSRDQSISDSHCIIEWGASDDEIVPDSTTKNNEELTTLSSCKNCKDDSDYIKLGDAKGKSGKKKKKKKNQVVDISMFFSDNERNRNRYRSDSMNWRKRPTYRRDDYRGRNDYECDSQDKLLQQKLEKLTMDERNTSKYNQNSLRDSANHSPAEAMMLASPTLSHCSDNHSEGGSSDSGKGCSEVATPAGGSSLAGDNQVPIVFEFVVPQPIVGRLIGFKGRNLLDLRSKSNTNIYVKMHPETTELRICAIEGTTSDVDCALALIRKKFPLSQNPGLTLERISPNDFNLQIKPEIFQLHLVENMNNDVVVSSLISAGYMFLQQPTHPTYQQLSRLNFTMNANYCSPDAPVMTEPQLNAVVAAPAMGGWYRAQIVEIIENNQCQVRFLDYGGYSTLDCSMLRKIRADFLTLPFQAIECALANVVPAGGSEIWSDEARLFVYEMTVGRVLQAQIYDYAVETGIPLVYLYSTCGEQVILINEELVKRGFAELPAYPSEEFPEVAEENIEALENGAETESEKPVENDNETKPDKTDVSSDSKEPLPETELPSTNTISSENPETKPETDEPSSKAAEPATEE